MLKIFIDIRKFTIVSFAAVSVIGGIFGNYRLAAAAVVNDNATGIYTDDFTDASGIAASTDAGVDVSDGTVKLKNADGDFAAPYSASGTVTLTLLRPLRVAKWGIVSIVASAPPGTLIKAQILDDSGAAFQNRYLPGNETGISSFPINASGVPVLQCADKYYPGYTPNVATAGCVRYAAVYIRFTLDTTDPNQTPSIDSVRFTYDLTQGVLSPSPAATGPWASYAGNQQGTHKSQFSNPATYPAFRWASSKYEGDYSVDQIYDLSDKLFGYTSWWGGYMFGMNKQTGAELWRLPFARGSSPEGVVSQNGTFYGTDNGVDYFYAIDTTTGQVKWTYFFGGGHGNDSTVIGSDGTIFTIRSGGLLNTVYAFNPDGTIKWTKGITIVAGTEMQPSLFSVGQDGTLYYGTSVTGPGNSATDTGKLYALDPADGTIKWSYDTGDVCTFPPLSLIRPERSMSQNVFLPAIMK